MHRFFSGGEKLGDFVRVYANIGVFDESLCGGPISNTGQKLVYSRLLVEIRSGFWSG